MGASAIEGSRRASGEQELRVLLLTYRRTRDPAARARLTEAYLPLVRALARRHAHSGERYEDLVQVGAVGLIEAIDRFDPGRGADFPSFAVPTITGEIRNHLRDRTTTVRVPRRLAELTARLRPQREALAARLSRPPTSSEIARETGIPEAAVLEAIETEGARAPVPLSTDDTSTGGLECLSFADCYDRTEMRLLLAAGFRTLGERERRILHLRFYGDLSQAEIARELALSQIQVSRLIRASLERLRGALSEQGQDVATGRLPV